MPFETNIFVNCPFDPEYLDLIRPLLFTILALGFEPHIALERADGAEVRMDKILELIEESRFGVHDLSRLRAKRAKEYFRLNMPFELGVDYGCRLYKGPPWDTKRILILENKAHELKKALSDLSGSDVEAHSEEPANIPGLVRNWLAQAMTGEVPPPSALWGRFNEFVAQNYLALTGAGWSDEDIAKQPIRELIAAMRAWLHPPAPAGA